MLEQDGISWAQQVDKPMPQEITKPNHMEADIDLGEMTLLEEDYQWKLKELLCRQIWQVAQFLGLNVGLLLVINQRLFQGRSTTFHINCHNVDEKGGRGQKCIQQPCFWLWNPKKLPER